MHKKTYMKKITMKKVAKPVKSKKGKKSGYGKKS